MFLKKFLGDGDDDEEEEEKKDNDTERIPKV